MVYLRLNSNTEAPRSSTNMAQRLASTPGPLLRMASGVWHRHSTPHWQMSRTLSSADSVFPVLKVEPIWQYVSFFPTPNLLPSSHPLELILWVLSHLLKWRDLTSCQKRWKLCPKSKTKSGKGTCCSQRSPLPEALLTSRNQGSLSLEFILI